ncbi:hypothetical protein CQW39_31020 [Streptomyces griseofuscus]|uniref:helix-turn-helix domain-containing protein n=1 Tax=Streptomyces griseofuscus TaxID=146922 RepID=UPI000F655DD9|nr:hypothetical protein CQW39_31020 [Streptomyces griseofuscus]
MRENCPYGLWGRPPCGLAAWGGGRGADRAGTGARALRTRPIPSSTQARLRFLLERNRGSTRKVATMLGVSQRTVQRWVSKKAEARRPWHWTQHAWAAPP